jgi:hypothetical protein
VLACWPEISAVHVRSVAGRGLHDYVSPSALFFLLAAAIAYEPPSINKAWLAFVAHIPTILLIWVATIVIAVIGFVVSVIFSLVGIGLAGGNTDAEAVGTLAVWLGNLSQLPFAILSNLVGVLFVAVPAMHYDSGENISSQVAFRALLQRPLRYLLAGVLFSVVTTVGFLLCILPGIAVALVTPVFVNRIFLSDQPIVEAFTASSQAVYRSPRGRTFAGIQLLTWLVVVVVSVCTCGLGALVAVPVGTFYIQNSAYHQGAIS